MSAYDRKLHRCWVGRTDDELAAALAEYEATSSVDLTDVIPMLRDELAHRQAWDDARVVSR